MTDDEIAASIALSVLLHRAGGEVTITPEEIHEMLSRKCDIALNFIKGQDINLKLIDYEEAMADIAIAKAAGGLIERE
jgi:hypothetical protein